MAISDRLLGRPGTGWRPNAPDSRDADYLVSKLGFSEGDLPKSFSLRPNVKQVLNQGGTSSCVAHMLAHAIQIREVAAGVDYAPVSRLSIYYHARRLSSSLIVDKGTYIRNAMKAAKHYGIPDEKYWPFSTLKINSQPGYEAIGMGYQRRAGEYYHILDSGDKRTSAIRAALRAGYPVGFGTTVGSNFKSDSGKDILDPPKDVIGGHAVLCIGYQENTEHGTIYEILNSWGTNYKDHGCVWFTENYLQWGESRDFHIIKGWEKIKGGTK